MPEKLSGGCTCGAIHYECNANPIVMLNCHCRDCQQASGSAYAAIVVVPKGAVQIRGEPRYHKTVGQAGNAVERGFCPSCGSQVTVKLERRPDVLGLQAGSLDDPSTYDGCLYLQRAVMGSYGPEGAKAYARPTTVTAVFAPGCPFRYTRALSKA
jgi:hypothetical protein